MNFSLLKKLLVFFYSILFFFFALVLYFFSGFKAKKKIYGALDLGREKNLEEILNIYINT